ncbi:hypothetical protein KSF_084090 [Reticulibacter mediterranei]|uniref:Uncharacterized protein n=1 Tax=Reticulibacter mediterranei TaxID=2778369 RepID=A0A8J3J006_9CHLR|nr:hypothetical protein [Reticulibacter mediterranei]GHO98361.1 hypothetical protein KSF_084090 [Reticulibacter mediterranei]
MLTQILFSPFGAALTLAIIALVSGVACAIAKLRVAAAIGFGIGIGFFAFVAIYLLADLYPKSLEFKLFLLLLCNVVVGFFSYAVLPTKRKDRRVRTPTKGV